MFPERVDEVVRHGRPIENRWAREYHNATSSVSGQAPVERVEVTTVFWPFSLRFRGLAVYTRSPPKEGGPTLGGRFISVLSLHVSPGSS